MSFLKYWFFAKNAHGIHSPFVFDFYKKIYKGKTDSSDFTEIENLRDNFLRDRSLIKVNDLGAGSKHARSDDRKISQIAKNSLKERRWCEFLVRLSSLYQPMKILELGTSLGITTSYLAKNNPEAGIYTIEGARSIAERAAESFRRLNLDNIIQKTGNIDDLLPEVLSEMQSVDLVLFDANHRYKPTIKYFEQCLKYTHDHSVFVFDDIYWSKEMQSAWDEIKLHPKVTLSLDLYQLGLIFFMERKQKEHFVLK